MKFHIGTAWIVVVTLGFGLSCSDKEDSTNLTNNSEYPSIHSFTTTPSDQFIIANVDMKKVTRAHPFKGAGLSCSHQGAHLHFKDSIHNYTVNIYAPADGTITRITTCYDLGNGNDKYDLALAFAKDGGNDVLFCYSLEPFAGMLCTGNPDAYKQYILVTLGQKVKKGDVIARLFKEGDVGDDTHLHFHLQNDKTGTFHCPNIFNAAISSAFQKLHGNENCSGTAFGSTGLCYLPGAGEDLTGL